MSPPDAPPEVETGKATTTGYDIWWDDDGCWVGRADGSGILYGPYTSDDDAERQRESLATKTHRAHSARPCRIIVAERFPTEDADGKDQPT